MKNFDGILRLPATCDELGKNGPFAPSPSLFIDERRDLWVPDDEALAPGIARVLRAERQ